MATIYVDGKPIEVPDAETVNRPAPSNEYEPVQADFFDVEKMVEESKSAWIEGRVLELVQQGVDEEAARKQVGGLPDGVEDRLREGIVEIINETIETEMEKFELYRNYTKAGCQKLIDKYEDLLSNSIIECRQIGERMKPYAHLVEEKDPAVLEAHTEELGKLDALYAEWVTEDLKRQKFQIFVDDFRDMQEIAPN